MPRLFIILLLTLLPLSTLAQDSPTTDPQPPDTTTAPVAPDTTEPNVPEDTVTYERTADLDVYMAATDTIDLESNLYQNPTVALFKSALIPGWGQFGNRRYIKATIFFALDVWMVTSAIKHGRDAADAWDRYQAATEISERNALYDDYSSKRDQRNKFTWFAVIVSFFSMFDAYVDAHLSGFPDIDRSKDFSVDIAPDNQGGVKALINVPF